MRNVSAAFHEAALSSDRTIAVKAVFNGNTEVNGSHIIDVSISETMFSDQTLTMGEAFSSKAVINMYMPSSDAPVKSGYVDISVGLLVNGAFEYCSLGRFYISSAESKDNYKTVKITAFDLMSKLNIPYVPDPDFVYIPEDDEHYDPDDWDLSKTYVYMHDALLDIQWNHDLEDTDFMYDGEIIAIPDGITERQLVAYIAGYSGGNAVIVRTDDDGDNYQRLVCKWYTETDIVIPPEAQYQHGFKRIQENDYELESLTSGTADNVLVKGVGTGPVFTNPFMDIHQLNILFNRVNGFTYTPCELKYRYDPSIELGDIITVVDVDGKSYKVPVMSQEIKISGGMSATITAVGVSEQSSGQPSSVGGGGGGGGLSSSDWVKINEMISALNVLGEITKHNQSETAHGDIRMLIEELTKRINATFNSEDVDLDQLSELVAYIKSNRSLIESVTTSKVSVSDIINNLTTNVSNKPLSAAQGVALKKLIDAIHVPTLLSELGGDSTHRLVTDAEKQVWNNKSNFSGSYNDLSNKPTIPSKTSQLTNDSNFMSATEVINKINERLADNIHWKFQIMDDMPEPETYEEGIIYLVPSVKEGEKNYFDEYVFVEGILEKLGSFSTEFNPANYYESIYVDQLLNELKLVLRSEMPSRTSQLNNDAGFITAEEVESGEATWDSLKGNILETVETSITWDGNTEGRETHPTYTAYHKVSDVVISAEDAVGLRFSTSLGYNHVVPAIGNGFANTIDNGTYWFAFLGIMCVYDESAGCSTGIYFPKSIRDDGTNREEYTSELILENEQIKQEYLPEGIGGGSVDMSQYMETVGSDTLTWDGNTEGLENLMGTMYRVTDIVITENDIQNTFSFTMGNEVEKATFTVEKNNEENVYFGDGSIILAGYIFVIPNDNYTNEELGISSAKKGIYFLRLEEDGVVNQVVTSLTINGYNGFKKEVIKEEYLPLMGGTVKSIVFNSVTELHNWLTDNWKKVLKVSLYTGANFGNTTIDFHNIVMRSDGYIFLEQTMTSDYFEGVTLSYFGINMDVDDNGILLTLRRGDIKFNLDGSSLLTQHENVEINDMVLQYMGGNATVIYAD